MPTGLDGLDANLERLLSLEEQASTARATVHEALVNVLQSRSELSTSGAMLSAATRHAMGKRGVAQLEASKRVLDMVVDTAALVRGDASSLRDEVTEALAARDAAVAAAARAKSAQQETCERLEAEGAAHVVATNEVAARAQQEATEALARAEGAELRAEAAERGFRQAEQARTSAVLELSEATAARDEAVGRLSSVESQLEREREVLARVMAENVVFVRKLEFVQGERDKARTHPHPPHIYTHAHAQRDGREKEGGGRAKEGMGGVGEGAWMGIAEVGLMARGTGGGCKAEGASPHPRATIACTRCPPAPHR